MLDALAPIHPSGTSPKCIGGQYARDLAPLYVKLCRTGSADRACRIVGHLAGLQPDTVKRVMAQIGLGRSAPAIKTTAR